VGEIVSEEKETGFFASPLGRILLGFLLLVLAPIIIAITLSIPLPSTIDIGGQTVDLTAFIVILRFIIPFAIVFQALRYLGIKL
jgi:hypothetical protein